MVVKLENQHVKYVVWSVNAGHALTCGYSGLCRLIYVLTVLGTIRLPVYKYKCADSWCIYFIYTEVNKNICNYNEYLNVFIYMPVRGKLKIMLSQL